MKGDPNPVNLGPWPFGIDNVDDEKAEVFEPGRRDAKATLREAINVDLDREGWPSRRTGRTKILDLVDGHSLAAADGRLLFVNDKVLSSLNVAEGTANPITTVGSAPLSYTEEAGVTWFLSTEAKGILSDGEVSTWGLKPPAPPELAYTAEGNLRAGRYMVALTVEKDGVESGARRASVIELEAQGGISVTTPLNFAEVDAVNIYCSDADNKGLFFIGTYYEAAPWSIRNVSISADILDGMGEYDPPLGTIVRNYNGRQLIVSGNALYWSQPLAYHRFKIQTDLQLFPSAIVFLEPTDGGFYVATEDRMWWVGGDDPEEWKPNEIDTVGVPEGDAIALSGGSIPAAEHDGVVLVWATAKGFVAGLPNGKLKHITEGRVAIDSNTKAAITYREQNGLRQILTSMRNKKADTTLKPTDVAECTVIKANITV